MLRRLRSKFCTHLEIGGDHRCFICSAFFSPQCLRLGTLRLSITSFQYHGASDLLRRPRSECILSVSSFNSPMIWMQELFVVSNTQKGLNLKQHKPIITVWIKLPGFPTSNLRCKASPSGASSLTIRSNCSDFRSHDVNDAKVKYLLYHTSNYFIVFRV